jgi:excisionase family DNA binding protein
MNLVHVDDAAKFAGVHRATIYRWIETGHLPTVEVEGVGMIEGKEFRRYVSERNKKRHAAKNVYKQAQTMRQ